MRTTGLRAWWRKATGAKSKPSPAPTKAHYICSCVHLNAVAARRRTGVRSTTIVAPVTPLDLPTEFITEKRDTSVVGGRRVPFSPIQVARWRGRRKAMTIDSIAETKGDCTGAIVCPGCSAQARLSSSATVLEDSDDEDDY
ncbi:hypothetical protein ACHHYP_17120 [Achlya hypogyna]|uniref:Uncharacterized protein n=1 Tax=Achlya hypogyna TaxID=1202772 RepID=A0A1V9Y541_ACHHY|nr:hypothetical protein ACHHYP_17120 [Achlya hypogyna]